MRNKRYRKVWLLTLGLLLVACGSRSAYNHFEHIQSTKWEKTDTLEFNIPPIASSGTYQEELELRIDNTFPYLSLTTEITETVFPEGKQTTHTNTWQLIEQNGEMKGSGVGIFQYTFPFATNQLYSGDSLHITVVHNMRREIMPGIVDVGIRLRKR